MNDPQDDHSHQADKGCTAHMFDGQFYLPARLPGLNSIGLESCRRAIPATLTAHSSINLGSLTTTATTPECIPSCRTKPTTQSPSRCEVFPEINYGMPTISRTPECAASVAGVDMVGHSYHALGAPNDAPGRGIVCGRGMRNGKQNNSRVAI